MYLQDRVAHALKVVKPRHKSEKMNAEDREFVMALKNNTDVLHTLICRYVWDLFVYVEEHPAQFCMTVTQGSLRFRSTAHTHNKQSHLAFKSAGLVAKPTLDEELVYIKRRLSGTEQYVVRWSLTTETETVTTTRLNMYETTDYREVSEYTVWETFIYMNGNPTERMNEFLTQLSKHKRKCLIRACTQFLRSPTASSAVNSWKLFNRTCRVAFSNDYYYNINPDREYVVSLLPAS